MGTIWISWEEAWRALASAPGTCLDRGPQGKALAAHGPRNWGWRHHLALGVPRGWLTNL